MAERMSEDEWRQFLSSGTKTAKVATVRKDGRAHVVPVWFLLDGSELVFTTGSKSIKGLALQRDARVCLCVDEEQPPYAFVSITGEAHVSEDQDQLLDWATSIAARYMGSDKADAYGRRNAVEGELLVRVKPTNVFALSAVAS